MIVFVFYNCVTGKIVYKENAKISYLQGFVLKLFANNLEV